MKLGILLSGGKDSLYAAFKASKSHELVCAITIKSLNEESYMFHTPNIDFVKFQAEAMEIPLIEVISPGIKESELKELEKALKEAKERFNLDGIVTGAVASQYQASRIQKICFELDLWCINPLWLIEQNSLLKELIKEDFEVLIAGVFAYPFGKEWLGKMIEPETIKELKDFQKKFLINPAGEGGEIETFVTDCPLFKKKIIIEKFEKEYSNYAGIFRIKKISLKEKFSKNEIKKSFDKKQFDEDLPQKYVEDIKEKEGSKNDEQTRILIIDTSSDKIPSYKDEFVRPLTTICEEEGFSYETKNIASVKNDCFDNFEKIIISGTSLKDNEFLKFHEKINYLISLRKPILGICAGAELLIPEHIPLKKIIEIGPKIISTSKEDDIIKNLDEKEAFFLHQLGIKEIPKNNTSNDNNTINNNTNKNTNNKSHNDIEALMRTDSGIACFKYVNQPIYGFQFHPEVNHKEIIRKFLKL